MEIEVLMLGPMAERAGASRLVVRTGPNPTPGEILAAVRDRLGDGAAIPDGARVAVNHAYARTDTVIRAGDEVALIALVGGG